jgi:hypothetical protein
VTDGRLGDAVGLAVGLVAWLAGGVTLALILCCVLLSSTPLLLPSLSLLPNNHQTQSALRRSSAPPTALARTLALCSSAVGGGSSSSGGGAAARLPGLSAAAVDPAASALLDVSRTAAYRVTNTFGPVLRGVAKEAAGAAVKGGVPGAPGALDALESFLKLEE